MLMHSGPFVRFPRPIDRDQNMRARWLISPFFVLIDRADHADSITRHAVITLESLHDALYEASANVVTCCSRHFQILREIVRSYVLAWLDSHNAITLTHQRIVASDCFVVNEIRCNRLHPKKRRAPASTGEHPPQASSPEKYYRSSTSYSAIASSPVNRGGP